MISQSNIQEIIDGLSSKQKLERDKNLNSLVSKLPNYDQDFFNCLLSSFIRVIETPEEPWESYHGILQGISKLLSFDQPTKVDAQFNSIRSSAYELLLHSEVRVRLAAGEVLGCLCALDNCYTYTELKSKILELIKRNLERGGTSQMRSMSVEETSSSDGLECSLESKIRQRRGSGNAEQIFHDTAGWRNLETSMSCLQHVIVGCGRGFAAFVDQELMELIFVTLNHPNRFVRETGYSVCTVIITCGVEGEEDLNSDHPLIIFGDQLANHLSIGLADNWSQVRLAASIAARKFFTTLPILGREKYFPLLLPRICLNRYYVAEGVKLYSQETWRLVTGTDGRKFVEKYIDDVVRYYIEATTADNHAVREAACQCIAELASKIPHSVLTPHVEAMLQALKICFNDDSWPVRDAACLACGNFISCFPEQSSSQIEELLPLFFNNLEDNIPSVRQGAASSIAKLVKVYPNRLSSVVSDWVTDALNGVKDQPSESLKYSNLETGPATYGVVKQKRDNDIDLHSNQQMYSCGSLAPKMGRGGGGGCSGGHFRRPIEKWERADGSLYLISELSSLPNNLDFVTKILPQLPSACSYKHYTSHLTLIESLCKVLPSIANGVGKKTFKSHLYSFFDLIFYALKSENALSATAASHCLQRLAEFLGPNILKGRIEEHNPLYLDTYQSTVHTK